QSGGADRGSRRGQLSIRGAEKGEPKKASREERAENDEPKTTSRKQRTENNEPKTTNASRSALLGSPFYLTPSHPDPTFPSTLQGNPRAYRSRRHPGHARPAHSQNPRLGADARLRGRALDQRYHRRRPPNRGGRSLHRAPSHGEARVARQ